MPDDFLYRLKSNKWFQKLDECLAEPQSPYSATIDQTLVLRMSRITARNSEAILFLLSLKDFQEWQTERIIRHLSFLCYRNNYQGEWSNVQELLETKIHLPREFFEAYKRKHGEDEFFGNLLKEAYLILKSRVITKRNYYSVIEDTRRIKRKIRRRGYDDKGTLRLSHQFHGDPPVRDSQREDRRNEVFNSLARIG